MVPGIRSLVSLPAGARHMPWWEFGVLTLLGSLIWNTVFVYGGYALGTRWYLVERYSGVFQVVGAGACSSPWSPSCCSGATDATAAR